MGIKPTCKEVHRLVSEGMDRPLTFAERIRRTLHLSVCDACSTFDEQMAMIRQAMHRMSAAPEQVEMPKQETEREPIPVAKKSAIQTSIKNEKKEN